MNQNEENTPSRIRIRFVNRATGKTSNVEQPLTEFERRALISACRACATDVDDRFLLGGVGACLHGLIHRRAKSYDEDDALCPAAHFREFLSACDHWGECLSVVVVENARTGPNGQRIHLWEVEATKPPRPVAKAAAIVGHPPSIATPEVFVRKFVDSMHASVHEFILRLPRFHLYYENQSWVGTKFFQLRRGINRQTFFAWAELPSLGGFEGSWDGKEIPRIIEAITDGERIQITRLRPHEMAPLTLEEVIALTEKAQQQLVCRKLRQGIEGIAV